MNDDDEQPTAASSKIPPGSSQPLSQALFTPLNMAVAAAMGTMLAAVYMLTRNYSALGYPQLAVKVGIVGVLVFLLLLGGSALMPQKAPEFALLLGLLQCFFSYGAGKVLQGDSIDYHRGIGTRLHSNWTAVSVGIVTLILLVGLLVLVLGGTPPAVENPT